MQLSGAVETYIRYDTQDEKGETRRSRNIRFGQGHLNLDFELPEEGVHLWEWFWQISNARPDNEKPINYRDLSDWISVTRNLINGQEIEILFAMDQAFRQTLANEIKANTARTEALRGRA